MRRRRSLASRMLLTTPRDLYAPVRIMLGQLTFRRSGRIAVVTGGAMDTHEDKQLRDPEDRVIDDCNQEQRRDKAMDKTLADSFPASDPPAWQS
jgi:hypothetical protein